MYGDGAPSPRVRRLRIVRLFLHLTVLLLSLALAAVAAAVLAYSMKVYYGSFLHAVPELMASGLFTALTVALAWIPRRDGTYGIRCMATVGGELAWTTFICLLTFASVTSLHESTPGLLAQCGPYFICSGYIALIVLGWLCWLSSAICFTLLLSSSLYQRHKRRREGIWQKNVTREWDFFWPDEAFTTTPDRHPRPFSLNVDSPITKKPRPVSIASPRPVSPMTPRTPYTPNERFESSSPPDHLPTGFTSHGPFESISRPFSKVTFEKY